MISRKAITVFWEKHPDALPSLSNWYAIVKRARWATFADQVDRRTVFNISGNKYRLIARVNYETQKVFVLHLLKHSEYSKGDWK